MLQWTWVCKYLFEILFSTLWKIYPKVGLLGNKNSIFNYLWNLHIIFHTSYTIYNPSNRTPVLILINTCYFLFFLIVVFLMAMRWYLTVVFICIYLMINNIENFLHILFGHLYVFFGEMSSLLPSFKMKCFLPFFLSCRSSLSMLATNFSDIQLAIIFSYSSIGLPWWLRW